MTWLYVEPDIAWSSNELSLEGKNAHYLGRVLRSRVGDLVTVFDGQGKTASATVVALSSRRAVLELGEVRAHSAPLGHVVAQIALVKGERLDFAAQKLTELGVDAIELITTERTVVQWPAERAPAKLARCRDIAIAAAAQCHRAWLPQLAGPTSVADLAVPNGALGLAMVPGPGAASVDRCMAGAVESSRVYFAIGPEGGFGDSEVELLQGVGYRLASLGPSVLRAETAALAAAVLVGHGIGRFRAARE